MIAGIAADAVVLIHLAFILFVSAGGLIVLRWPRLAWAHLPAVAWGALVELAGWICPLTPMENRLRAAAGESAYSGGFIDRYIVPIVYPPGLTRSLQIVIGCAVIGLNLFIYAVVLKRRLQKTKTKS
jgi:hypothetical protein